MSGVNKRGLIGWIILGVIVVILLGAGFAGIYFYNFYVFKTVRACVGEGVDTMFPCNETQDCVDALNMTSADLSDVPDFLGDKFQEVLDEVVYCDGNCFVKEVRGFDRETGEIEMLDSCYENEIEIALDIHGKEGLEVLKWMKEMSA